ncbi:MAG: DUF5312 domain-containing protein [Spirochaetaceae bacterium]
MSSKKFDDLTTNLSESEKKVLLNQINENLSANPIKQDEKYSNFKEKENKDFQKKSISKDIEGLGFFQKLFLNIRSFIMGKDIKEVYNNDLLSSLERRISFTAPTLVLLKKRRFTSILINDFIRINSLVSPFINIFSDVWESPIALEKLIGAILSEKYNSIKNTLFDFIRESEIDKSISEGESLEAVKKALLKSIYDYRKKIPDFIFPEAEEEFLAIISLKNIVLYNFIPIFKLMGISGNDSIESITNKSVSMSLVVRHVEDFYKLLIHFSGITLQQNSIASLIALKTMGNEVEEQQLWDSYTKLSEKLKSLTVAYPFEDLIKFSKGNPFYKIDFSVSKINLVEFYFSTLKKEMLAELAKVYGIRERAVTNQLFVQMFKNFDKVKLNNYRVYKEFDYKNLKLKYFRYIDTLSILINFLKHYYSRDFKDIIFVLSKHIYEKNHMLQSKSLEISIGIETLQERIIKFDRSMSPESDGGKTMKTLFSAVASNRQNLRMYKAFIKQKDEEVLELLKLGSRLFKDLEKIMLQTLKSPSDTVKLQVSAIHPTISRKHTFKDILIEKGKVLKKFIDIYSKKIIFDSE